MSVTTPLALRLGLPADAKVVIAHADDIGMCHGANVAFRDLCDRGFITCGSVMVPCPWFRETGEMAAADPALDLGVHLTLTSEWRHYRWRPLTDCSKASGLVDDEGYMWRTAREVRLQARPDAVEAELRAQIEAARDAGLDATHLDCHMGTALAPEFADIYVRLGEAYRLPLLFPRDWSGYGCGLSLGMVDTELHARRVAAVAGVHLVVDAFHETPWSPPGDMKDAYRELIAGIGLGVTFLAFHPNAAGDIEVIDPPRWQNRTTEHRLFADPAFLALVESAGVHLVGTRRIREVLRRS